MILRTAFVGAILFGVACSAGGADGVDAAASPIGRKIDGFALQDYLGAKYALADWPDKRAIVVVFLGAECPLAKQYGSRQKP